MRIYSLWPRNHFSLVLIAIIVLLVGMRMAPAGIAAPPAQQPTPTYKWDTPTPPPTETPPPTPTPLITASATPTTVPPTAPPSEPAKQPAPTPAPAPVLLPETGGPPVWLVLPALLLIVASFILRARNVKHET